MNEESVVGPLPGDSARQAVGSIRGYAYQIWRTIEQWIRLKEGETLFIECAEDFDVATPEHTTAVQVKDTQTKISLASKDACDAILNFWTLRTRAVGNVRFQFLTTAGIATEQGVFLDRRPGIILWKEAAEGNTQAAEMLKQFLLNKFADIPAFKSFLEAQTAESLQTTLFRPFEWITEEPDAELVQEVIRRRLVAHGEERGYSPSISVKALDLLYSHCWTVAQRSEMQTRSLTREDFLLVFDKATSLPLPMSAQSLATFASALTSGASADVLSVAVLRRFWSSGIPPVPDPVLPRGTAVAGALQALSPASPLVLAGSVGKGKTTLAKLVAFSTREETIWVDLAGRETNHAETALTALALWLEDHPRPYLVVIDDFFAEPGLPQGLWTSFEILHRACKATRSKLLITTKGLPRERLDSRLLGHGIVVQGIEDLSQAEVEDFLHKLGCPDDSVDAWSRLTIAQTGGHPKLVHVRALDLQDQGWPKPTAGALLKTPASIEGQRESERLNVAQRETGARLEFLYHLTLLSLPFDRGLVLRLGGKIKGLSDPGTALDSFVGRWIEPFLDSYYRVTSLLTNEATKVWSSSQLKKAHGSIFDSFLEGKVLDASHAFSVLMHAFLAESASRVSGYVMNLLHQKRKAFAQLSKELKLIVHFGSGVGKQAVPFNSAASVFFRILQFRVAMREAPEELSRIADEWRWEVERQTPDELKNMSRLLWASTVASTIEGDLSPELILDALLMMDGQSGKLGRMPSLPAALSKDSGTQDLVTSLFTFFQARCKSPEYLDRLMYALAKIEPTMRNRMLGAVDLPFFSDYSFIVESAWIGELKKPAPNWHNTVEVLKRTRTYAKDWGITKLGLSAAKAISIVYDEHLHDRNAAVRALEEGRELFGPAPMLMEQLANIHFQHDELDLALGHWRSSLAVDRARPQYKVKDPFAFRKAAITAGKGGRFQEAAELFLLGSHWAREAKIMRSVAGLQFDAAYAAYKAGDLTMASTSLRDGLAHISGTPDPEAEFNKFALQKLAGHVALWLRNQVCREKDVGTVEPILGCCSNPTYDSGIKALPRSPFELIIGFVAEFEHRASLPLKTKEQFSSVLSQSKIPTLEMTLASIDLEQVFRRRDFLNLLGPLADMRSSLSRGRAQVRLKQHPMERFIGQAESSDVANLAYEYFFVLALTVHQLSGGKPLELLDAWQEQDRTTHQSLFAQHIAALRDATNEASNRPELTLRNPRCRHLARVAAASILIVETPTTPAASAYAEAAFISWLIRTDAKLGLAEVLPVLTEAFSKTWVAHIGQPALLNNPRINIPDLQSAISYEPLGAEKMRLLLTAGSAATSVRVPPETLDWLRQNRN